MKRYLCALRATLSCSLWLLRTLCLAALMVPALIVQAQTSSATTLASTPNPSSYAQSITLTASVAGDNPTGNVTFMDGAATLGTGTLSSGVAALSINTLSVGSHSLTATYDGDANNTTSTSSAVSQVVNTVSTTSTVTSSLNPATYNANVTFTATVAGNAPTGTVTFMDGAATLGTGTLGGTGDSRTTTFAVSALSVGSHSITVVYAGDTNNAGSTSAVLTQTINKVNTTSALASSANPATYNQNVTWTASITGIAPGGDVTFKDGATVLGTATLAGSGNTRTATYASSTLAVGSHSMTAVYAGDASNNTSTSAVLTQTINKLPTTTVLASSLNPSTYGQSVTWTATVNGGSNPGGVVTFKDGTTTLGTASLAAGVASFSSSSLTGGTHSITAVYAGDTNNATSTSAALAQAVSAQATSVALASSLNPSTAGQSVTLTATVTGSSPTGTVTFQDGATTLAARALSAGVATFSSKFTGGSHSLTAVYGGDTNNATSTSGALAQSVDLAATTMSLTVTPNPASLGQNVTLVARINNGYSPTGTVTFSDGGTALGTASVSAGAATLSLNSLGQGSHSLSAAYAGDSNNTASSAGAVSLTVNARSGMTWQYGYDAMGRINTIVDPNGLASYVYYDSLGRAIQTQQPPNTGSSTPTVIQMGYDLADGLTSVADPRNLATSYSPNGLGNVTAQSSPDSGTTTFTYDAKGNLLTSLDARGKQTSYAWDSLDRLTTISYPTGTTTTFEYDGGSSPTPQETGELTKITDESGQTSYSHDALGRLATKGVTIGAKTFTVSYNWGDSGSALDKLTAITYPSGSRVNYSYDAQGYVNAISVNPVNANGVGVSGTAQPLLGSITYNAENKITGWLWSDGKARQIGYDSVGLVSSYSLGDSLGSGTAAGVLRSVNRDSAGRISGYTHTNNGSAVATLDQSFGYDSLNRLLTASVGATSTLYSYDETGNRTSKAIGGNTYSNTIAATSNRLTQTQDVGGTATVVHDAAGHITSDGTNSYAYSDRGRMISATTAGGTVTYVYNGLNQRVGKTGPTGVVPTGAAYYLYDEAGQLLGEYDANGAPVYETVYLGTTPVGTMKQTGSAANSDIAVSLYNVHADHIDTPRMITQQDQTIVWRWDTAEAFGGTAPNQDPSSLGAFVFNQRFPGQVFDSETGLFQNWNREYNARLGRYVQSDPIGLEGGINTFAYVGGNPLSYVDPDGRIPIIIIPIVAAAVGGTLGGGANYLMQKYWQKKCEVNGLDVANAAFWGALGGAALPASGGTVLGAAGVGATANMGQYFTGQLMNGEAPTARDTAWNAATGAAGGAAGGAFARPVTYGAVGTALPLVARDRQTMTTVGANTGVGTTLRNFFGALVGNAPLESPNTDCTCRK